MPVCIVEDTILTCVPQLLDAVFPPSLRKYLQQQDAIFVLLACGAAFSFKSSFEDILNLGVR
jgi:hypothetical protein